jgi:hypothetical protein
MSKIRTILDVIERKKTGTIPVIPVTTKFAVSRSPYSFAECDSDPRKYIVVKNSVVYGGKVRRTDYGDIFRAFLCLITLASAFNEYN